VCVSHVQILTLSYPVLNIKLCFFGYQYNALLQLSCSHSFKNCFIHNKTKHWRTPAAGLKSAGRNVQCQDNQDLQVCFRVSRHHLAECLYNCYVQNIIAFSEIQHFLSQRPTAVTDSAKTQEFNKDFTLCRTRALCE
jgi:hypothetical protein